MRPKKTPPTTRHAGLANGLAQQPCAKEGAHLQHSAGSELNKWPPTPFGIFERRPPEQPGGKPGRTPSTCDSLMAGRFPFGVLVLVGACQSGTVRAGLCLIHHHQENSAVQSRLRTAVLLGCCSFPAYYWRRAAAARRESERSERARGRVRGGGHQGNTRRTKRLQTTYVVLCFVYSAPEGYYI